MRSAPARWKRAAFQRAVAGELDISTPLRSHHSVSARSANLGRARKRAMESSMAALTVSAGHVRRKRSITAAGGVESIPRNDSSRGTAAGNASDSQALRAPVTVIASPLLHLPRTGGIAQQHGE